MNDSVGLARLTIRAATERDISRITDINAHHVLTGLASLEVTPPDAAEMRRRLAAVIEQELPYLVAEWDGVVAGYAYAGPYRARAAYRYTLEDSVYVHHALGGRGIGKELLERLIKECTAGGWRQMVAVIGDSANRASIALHKACGFKQVGLLPAVGCKFGRWIDCVLMQRSLGEGDATLPTGEG